MPTADDSHLHDQGRVKAWRRQLLDKGQSVAKALEDLLSKKNVDLASLRVPLLPERDPELRLRRFLEMIDRRIKVFESGGWGRCLSCGEALDPVTLDQAPWTERCAAHAER